MSNDINELLQGNRRWVDRILDEQPTFFDQLSEGQTPEYLWIGCADSRVPATEITNSLPGSIFVQRNIANLVVHTDSNLLSVAYFAVQVLKVKHIIVCGHYGCGGIEAAMTDTTFGFLDNWLMHLKDVYAKHADELNSLTEHRVRFDRFVELNIQEQVKNLARTSFIQQAWKTGAGPEIHGWVYAINDGLIRDLGVSVSSNKSLEEIYRYGD